MQSSPSKRWTDTAEAAELLARIATSPPEYRTFRDRFGDEWTRYMGGDVAKLRKLHAAAMVEAINLPSEIERRREATKLTEELSVENVIDRVIQSLNAPEARAA